MLWEERILEIVYLATHEIVLKKMLKDRRASLLLARIRIRSERLSFNRCQKEKRKNCRGRDASFSNRFSFIINRGIGSNEKHSGRRSPVWKSFHRILNCPLSSFFLSSWFSVASTRRRWARIGTAATSVAGSATSLWPGNATCWGTSTLTASSATRAYSRMGARSATKSSVSIPRYDTLYSSTTR